MDPLDPFLLPPDVVLTAVADLPAHVREQVSGDGEFAITRPRARSSTRVLSRDSADLIQEFRTAKTVVEAVIKYCSAKGGDPESTLVESFPILQNLVAAEFLVPADSENAVEIEPGFKQNQVVEGYTIMEMVQTLDDSEVYRVSSPGGQLAALKIARGAENRSIAKALHREAQILQALQGAPAPRFLAEGKIDKRRYLVMSWIEGRSVVQVAEELRRHLEYAKLISLCVAVVRAYGSLHARDILHCDVHPRNVIITGANEPVIIDFGLALRSSADHHERRHVPRGGVPTFFEPEYAKARIAGQAPPPATQASEQYALGALIYLMIAGHPYLQFAVGKTEMLSQIVQDPPRPLDTRAIPNADQLQKILHRALAKEPGSRFASVEEFGNALAAAEIAEVARPPATQGFGTLRERFAESVLRRFALDGTLFQNGYPSAPRLSINYGSAGAAYALYRLAVLHGDAEQLALADAWATRAFAQRTSDGGFYNDEMGLSAGKVGPISPYHSPSGVFFVRALIAHAMGDFVSVQNALQGFVAEADQPCENPDLTLGRASVLLACSLLSDAIPEHVLVDRASLTRLGERIALKLEEEITGYSAIAECKEVPMLGIAHGWAGVLYALMLWGKGCGKEPARHLRERLQQLEDLGEARGAGLRWKIRLDTKRARVGYMSGWCNGAAGMVFLWLLASESYGEAHFLELAEKAARNAWEEADRATTLCCGSAGSAYALLALYRAQGEKIWLTRGEEFADKAVQNASAGAESSLYKGDLGIALLAYEIAHPTCASMPVFELERWRRV
jgi:serine/threonine protein kinase